MQHVKQKDGGDGTPFPPGALLRADSHRLLAGESSHCASDQAGLGRPSSMTDFEEEESLKRIIDIINNELKGITYHYDRKLRSQNRWIAALFLMLKDAGIKPSSKDILNALRRIDENAKHSA